MKIKYRILLYTFVFCLSLLLAFAYYNFKKDDNITILSEMIDNKAIIDLDSFCFYSKHQTNVSNIINSKYKYIYYFDSTCCSPCVMNKLSVESTISKEHPIDNLSFIYVFDVSPKDTAIFYDNFSDLSEDVFLDTAHLIIKKNKYITSNPITHTFLIDENRIIRLVGNPVKNDKVEELLLKITNK